MRALVAADWPSVAAIFAAGIADGDATFETQVPSWADWDAAHLHRPRLVADGCRGPAPGHHAPGTGPGRALDGPVAGWAALSPVSERCVYGGVAEVSVYVDPAAQGRGVGRTLLAGLVEESEAAGLWTLQAGVFPENPRSLDLHERAGFRVVGRRERLGARNGVWRDVVLLERRSNIVGT